jgi:hypothetical protein
VLTHVACGWVVMVGTNVGKCLRRSKWTPLPNSTLETLEIDCWENLKARWKFSNCYILCNLSNTDIEDDIDLLPQILSDFNKTYGGPSFHQEDAGNIILFKSVQWLARYSSHEIG